MGTKLRVKPYDITIESSIAVLAHQKILWWIRVYRRTCWEGEILHALSTGGLTGVKSASATHVTHVRWVAQLTGLHRVLASPGELYITVKVRIAVRAAHTSLSDQVAIATSRKTFPVAKTALEKGAIWVTELSWELDVGGEVLELTRVPRAGTIILHGRAVDEGVTKHSIWGIALVEDKLDVASSNGCTIRLSHTRSRGGLSLWKTWSFDAHCLPRNFCWEIGEEEHSSEPGKSQSFLCHF
jgi:hypothetical protein